MKIKNNITGRPDEQYQPKVFVYLKERNGDFTLKYSLNEKNSKYSFTTSEASTEAKIVFGYNWIAGGALEQENGDASFTDIMLNKGETILPYEPYTGGKPSPSPEYPQSIEVTDKSVIITIKGGTEQQSITLVPPRPLTKWDKLEKIDGVWQWVYQSECLKFENSDGWAFYPNSYNKAKFQLQKKSEINYEDKFLQKDLLCSHFAENINAYYNSGNTCSFTISSIEANSLYFKFGQESNVSNMETFKKWIGENKPAVIYKAATPEYIPLSQSEQNALNSLMMYTPTTEITNDGGCNMELTYTVDTKSYVDTKIAEISKAML